MFYKAVNYQDTAIIGYGQSVEALRIERGGLETIQGRPVSEPTVRGVDDIRTVWRPQLVSPVLHILEKLRLNNRYMYWE